MPIWTACEIWNKERKSLLFDALWTPAAGLHTHTKNKNKKKLPCTHTSVYIKRVIIGRKKKTHAHIFYFYFLLSYFLQVVLEYLRCVIRHPFPSELERKKEILDRKVYKKKPLWIFDILCTAASKWVWRGKEKPTPRCCFFCLFVYLLPFLLFQRDGG